MKKITLVLFILGALFVNAQDNKTVKGTSDDTNKLVLDYEYRDFNDAETNKFNEEEAYKTLPWEIIQVYNFLKEHREIVYNVQKIKLKEGGNVELTKKGYKILVKKQELELKKYDFLEKEFIKQPEIKFDNTSTMREVKFLPFFPMQVFRVLDEKEVVEINNRKYECTIVEGFVMGEKWKYWMVTETPGLIVKALNEDPTFFVRRIWLIDKY